MGPLLYLPDESSPLALRSGHRDLGEFPGASLGVCACAIQRLPRKATSAMEAAMREGGSFERLPPYPDLGAVNGRTPRADSTSAM